MVLTVCRTTRSKCKEIYTSKVIRRWASISAAKFARSYRSFIYPRGDSNQCDGSKILLISDIIKDILE